LQVYCTGCWVATGALVTIVVGFGVDIGVALLTVGNGVFVTSNVGVIAAPATSGVLVIVNGIENNCPVDVFVSEAKASWTISAAIASAGSVEGVACAVTFCRKFICVKIKKFI
jgi:hypothetical protein